MHNLGVKGCSSIPVQSRGPSRRASAYKISRGFRISEWFSGFQSGFLDFKVDFWISSGFLDFKVDFWIAKWISGFQADFWISKRISGFHLNRYYSEDTAKIYS